MILLTLAFDCIAIRGKKSEMLVGPKLGTILEGSDRLSLSSEHASSNQRIQTTNMKKNRPAHSGSGAGRVQVRVRAT
jgi:hypothetical protein